MQDPAGTRSHSYGQDMAIIRTKWQWLLLIVALAFLFGVFPFVSSTYTLHLVNKWGILIIAALGLNVLVGRAGLISIAHAAFVAVGAFSSAILVSKLSFPFLLAVPCSGLIAGLVGVFFGLPSLRIKGLYLLAATLGAQFIIEYVVRNWTDLTGGYAGYAVPYATLGNIVFDTHREFFFITATVLIIMTLLASSLNRNRLGRALVAIRSNDVVAEALGVNLLKYKLLAFFIACCFAGVAGSLWAHWMGGRLTMESFTLWGSIWYLGYIVVGGLGSITGVFAGVLFIEGTQEILREVITNVGMAHPQALAYVAPSGDIAFGLILILFLILEPRGLANRWEIIKSYYRLWPFSHRA